MKAYAVRGAIHMEIVVADSISEAADMFQEFHAGESIVLVEDVSRNYQ